MPPCQSPQCSCIRQKQSRCQKGWKTGPVYIRDEKGRVVKTDDHACDAMRYLCMSGKDVAKYPQQAQAQRKFQQPSWVA